MKDILKRTTNSLIFTSIIAIIIGLVMIFYPGLSIDTIRIIVAAYLILQGVVIMALDLSSSKYMPSTGGLILGLLSIILGGVFFAKPGLFSMIFTIAVGVWVIVSSINTLRLAASVTKPTSAKVALFIFGILDLLIGLLILFNPFESMITFTVLAGIVITAHAVIRIIDMCILKHNAKQISKLLG